MEPGTSPLFQGGSHSEILCQEDQTAANGRTLLFLHAFVTYRTVQRPAELRYMGLYFLGLRRPPKTNATKTNVVVHWCSCKTTKPMVSIKNNCPHIPTGELHIVQSANQQDPFARAGLVFDRKPCYRV